MNTQDLQNAEIDPNLPDKLFFADPEQYLNEWKQSGQDIKQLSADGIFYLAGKFNIGVKDVEIRLSEDGKNYLASATAYDLNSHRTMIGNACVPLYYSGNRLNPNAYELASTLVQRNAIRKMIPHKQIMQNLESISNGKGIVSGPASPPVQNSQPVNQQQEKAAADPLEEAKVKARKAIQDPDVISNLAKMNLTANDVFKQAEVKGGSSNDWPIKVWDRFTWSLYNIEESWIAEWANSKNVEQADVEPEPEAKAPQEEAPQEEVVEQATDEQALLENASSETEQTEQAEEASEEESVDETKEQVKAETIRVYNTRKDELQEKGITNEMFWRLGVAKRYDVTSSDDLTINDWKHLGQSLTMPEFAEWIQELNNKDYNEEG